MTSPVRVIGVGTDWRGDDAAGLAVADRLRCAGPPGLEVVRCAGGAAELLDAFDGADDVVVVDAVVSGAPPGTVHRLTAPEGVAGARPGGGTHDAGVADAVALAAALGRLPARVRVVGIEAADTAMGCATLTAEVARAVDEVAGGIAAEARRRLRVADEGGVAPCASA